MSAGSLFRRRVEGSISVDGDMGRSLVRFANASLEYNIPCLLVNTGIVKNEALEVPSHKRCHYLDLIFSFSSSASGIISLLEYSHYCSKLRFEFSWLFQRVKLCRNLGFSQERKSGGSARLEQ